MHMKIHVRVSSQRYSYERLMNYSYKSETLPEDGFKNVSLSSLINYGGAILLFDMNADCTLLYISCICLYS